MYELGDQFKFDLNKSTANKDCIFKGDRYRITILTERLVRLEYNENGTEPIKTMKAEDKYE